MFESKEEVSLHYTRTYAPYVHEMQLVEWYVCLFQG
jgi:hypothetical protein